MQIAIKMGERKKHYVTGIYVGNSKELTALKNDPSQNILILTYSLATISTACLDRRMLLRDLIYVHFRFVANSNETMNLQAPNKWVHDLIFFLFFFLLLRFE